VIDNETFEQLLDLDEEDEHEFSKQMADDYFGQVEVTFKDLDTAL
jgi:osomolarity two-component system phosphorelay intermediate protein YPD1